MCCFDSRLVHYRILGRHTTYVYKSVSFQQILVKHFLKVRVVMKVQDSLNVLYFKQGARELYKLNVQFLTFYHEVLSRYSFFLMHH